MKKIFLAFLISFCFAGDYDCGWRQEGNVILYESGHYAVWIDADHFLYDNGDMLIRVSQDQWIMSRSTIKGSL